MGGKPQALAGGPISSVTGRRRLANRADRTLAHRQTGELRRIRIDRIRSRKSIGREVGSRPSKPDHDGPPGRCDRFDLRPPNARAGDGDLPRDHHARRLATGGRVDRRPTGLRTVVGCKVAGADRSGGSGGARSRSPSRRTARDDGGTRPRRSGIGPCLPSDPPGRRR